MARTQLRRPPVLSIELEGRHLFQPSPTDPARSICTRCFGWRDDWRHWSTW